MQQPPKKNYYKLTPDAPASSDKKRMSDLAKELEKEDFYGKKKPVKAKTVEVKVSVNKNSPLMRAKSAKQQ